MNIEIQTFVDAIKQGIFNGGIVTFDDDNHNTIICGIELAAIPKYDVIQLIISWTGAIIKGELEQSSEELKLLHHSISSIIKAENRGKDRWFIAFSRANATNLHYFFQGGYRDSPMTFEKYLGIN